MRSIVIGAAVVGLVLARVPRADAWGNIGHMTVAKLAWDQLDKGQRLAAYQTLLKLPYLERFLDTHPKPKDVSDQEWLFLIAADWPDWLKDYKSAAKKKDKDGIEIFKEHIEDWHFLDIPYVYPDKDHFSGTLPMPRERDIVKALTTDVPALHKNDDPARRAVALCWLLHLVGDIHQPLHCTTRFTDDYPEGDVGGNNWWVHREGRLTELHGFWDDLPGFIPRASKPDSLPGYYAKVYAMVSDNATLLSRPAFAQETFADALKVTEPKAWAEESHTLGVNVAYQKGKVPGVFIGRKTPPHDASELRRNAPELPAAYVKEATAVADRQVALAGHRLADRLNALFPKNGPRR